MTDQALIEAADPTLQDRYALEEMPSVVAPDPMVGILAAFYSVPDEYHTALFNDFREAAEAKDLRRLLDAISDWAATAELYADKHLAQEVQQAIGEGQGLATWQEAFKQAELSLPMCRTIEVA